jgi:hypothetical protein
MEHDCDYVRDRFGKRLAAIHTSADEFMTIEEVLNLESEFTIKFWVKVTANLYDQTLLDFGNGAKNDNIVFYLSERNLIPVVSVYNGEDQVGSLRADKSVELNKWYNFAVTLSDVNLSLYINGALVKSHECSMKIDSTKRKTNYLGRSSWASEDYASADFDEIKIYNRCQSPVEIEKR